MSWSKLLTELARQQRRLEQTSKRLCSAPDAAQVFCAEGCSNCCSLAVNASYLEAVSIAGSLPTELRQRLNEQLPLLRQLSTEAESLPQFLRSFRQQFGGCLFLDNETGNCRIYPVRPFSCRALLSTRNSSWCAVDFAELHPLEKEAFLSSLDPEVVAFPTHYLAATQELGLELETAAVVAMRDAFGVALSGNLLYQVWLETEYQLSGILAKGSRATQAFLEQHDLARPYLVQLQTS